jgi:hypothetical protein
MTPLRLIVALAALAEPARAGCPIRIDGDPATAAALQGELAQFPDDGAPCIAVEVACAAEAGGVTLELRDELGGAAVRSFESPAGAAAFLVSWSRRPMVAAAPGTMPARPEAPLARAVAPTPGAARARWGFEARAAALAAPTALLAAVDLGALYTAADRQYGLVVRAITSDTTFEPYDLGFYAPAHWAYVATSIEGVGRFRGPALGPLRTRLELAGGGMVITRIDDETMATTSAYGVYGATRGAVSYPLAGGLAVELGAGLETLWQGGPSGRGRSPLGDGQILAYPHLEVGLRWAP